MLDTSFLQWPFFEQRHRQLAQQLDQWAKHSIATLVANEHNDLDGTCKALVTALGDAGFTMHAVAGTHNQHKLDVRTLCVIRETLARYHGLADFAFAMQGLGSGPISLFGTTEQRQRYLTPVGLGQQLSAFALSEADAGSDVANLNTTATRDGDQFVIDGEKTWISNGGIADVYTVFARTGEAPGAKGLSCFIVDADTPGLSITQRIDLIAPHPLATLRFEQCRIPASNQLGTGGKGFAIAMATLDVFRSTVGAAALGFARRALQEAVRHVKSRPIYGGVLSDLQVVQATIADMAVDVDNSALMVYRSAWTKDCAADRVTREAAMAKLVATESAQRVIDNAVQLHGGHGVVSGHIAETLYRDIRALRIYEGASAVQQNIIARQTLGKHRD